MTLDMLGVADALALRFDPANVTPPTNPVTGVAYPNIRESTARPGNNVPATPYVIVDAPDGAFIYEPGQRHGEWTFDVWFLFAKKSGDQERDRVAMLSWLGVLIDQLHGARYLGFAPTIKKALTESAAYGSFEYAGGVYHAWHLTVRVWTWDAVTLVAA